MEVQELIGQKVTLLQTIPKARCANYTNKWADLVKGSVVTIVQVCDATSLTVQVEPKDGIPVCNQDGSPYSGQQVLHEAATYRHGKDIFVTGGNGYRFQVTNKALAEATGLDLPESQFDLVGAMMQLEEGNLSEDEARELLTELRKQGLLGSLQGVYGRMAEQLGV